MKKSILFILFLFFGFVFSQVEYTHGPTQISFYETNTVHTIYIDNLFIDSFDGDLAEYSTETAPTGSLADLLNPLNPDESDAIFIYYSPNAGTEVCVGWTYFHKNTDEKTVLRVYGDDLFVNNPEIVSSYPSNNASGDLFIFKIYDANANEFGEVDILPGSINYPLSPFSHGSNQTVQSLSANNIFGCENPIAFNMNPDATAPCSLSMFGDCLDCGFGITNFHPIEGYVGYNATENIDCSLNSEEGNDVTIHWNTPNTYIEDTPGFEFTYIIIDEEFAGADTVVGDTSFVISDFYDWGSTVTIAVYAWNGYIGPNQELSYSGGTELYTDNSVTLTLCDEPLPNAPQNFNAVGNEGSVDLSWEVPDNGHTESYNLFVIGESDSINITSLNYTHQDLESDRMYYYYLRAVNTLGVMGDSTEIYSAMTAPMHPVQDYELRVGLQSIELNWEVPEPYGNDPVYNYTVYKWVGNGDNDLCDPGYQPCDENAAGYCNGNSDILTIEECESSGRKWIYDYQCVSYNYYFENDGYGNENIEILWDDLNEDGLYQEGEQIFDPLHSCRTANAQQPSGISQTKLVIDDNLDDTEYYCFSVVAQHSQGESDHSRIICGKPQPLFNWQIKIDVELEVSNTFSIYDTSNIIGSSGGNGVWDPNEDYVDQNFNGQYDIDEPFSDIGATDGYDPRFDLPEPMTPPNEWVQLYFPHENEGMWENTFNLEKFTQDIRELENYQSNPRTWLGHIVTDSPGELKISFDIKTEVDSLSNVDEDTLKFFTFIRGDFADEPISVLDQLVIDGHSGVHMSNGDCPFTLSGNENELCNETIEELFVDSMDTIQFAVTVGYKPPQPRQGLTALGDYRQITIYWDEPDECCSSDDGIFPPENYDIFRNMSIFGEDTTDSMIEDGLEQEYYIDIGDDFSVNDDWFSSVEIDVFGYPEDPRRLLDETEYFYTVRGENVAGEGPYTTAVSAMTGQNRNPVSIISLSSGPGLEGGIIAEDIDTVFTKIPHNGLGDLNPVSIFLDGSMSEDLDEPKDEIDFDWSLIDGDQYIDFENSQTDFIEVIVTNQFDTDTNYYHLELIITDNYFRGVWDDGEMNILLDHNVARDTVVIVVAPEVNQSPSASIMIDFGDYNEVNGIENTLENSEQYFDLVPEDIYPYLTLDPSTLSQFYPFFWIPPHDGDPSTNWAAIGFRGFGEQINEGAGILQNGYMDLDEFNTEMEDWVDIDTNGRWTRASYDPDDLQFTNLEYWGLEANPQGGAHDTLYFDWLIGQEPEILNFDTPPLNVYNEGDDFIDVNNNGLWDAGDPFTMQNLTIYRQPGIYDISLVVRDDYNYRDTASFEIHVLPEFNQLPNVRLGNFYDDRLSYHLPEGEQTYYIEFPLDTSGCVSWYNDSANPDIYSECGYPYGTIVSEPFNDVNGDGVYNEDEVYEDLYNNGIWDEALATLYDSDNIVENNLFYDTLLVHEISDKDFWFDDADIKVYDDLQYRWYVDGILRGEQESFGYDLGIGTHEVVVEVIDPYGSFDSLKTTDTVTVYISMEPTPAPVIASETELTEDLYFVELTWLESEFNNENDLLGIEADNWPFGFPQIAENAHIASEYKIFRKRPNAQNPIETIYMEVATLNVEEENEYFFSNELNGSDRKRFYFYDNGLYPGEEYCYQIKPANSHGQLAGNMICGENCGPNDADSETEICVETVKQFEIGLNNFVKPHIINSFEYDSIGYKIENGELQYIETDDGDIEITELDVCDDYKGIWNSETQSCELDPRPFLDRIEVAFQSLQMNGHSDWVDLKPFLYEYVSAQDSFYTYIDMDSSLTVNYLIDKHMLNGHIGYILNDSLGYVEMYANDGDETNDYLYSDYLVESDGNFGSMVYNDDILFRFRLYDHGDFDGQYCNSLENFVDCNNNPSCKWLNDESICDNYFYEEFTSSPLIITSDSLIHPLWTEDSDPFINNIGAAGAKFMFGLPFEIEDNILLNESFKENFVDIDILDGEFNDEWLITDDLGTSSNPLITGQANILWLQYPNLFKVGGQTMKSKSIPITEGWNLLTNPLVAKIHKTSLQFITPQDINNCSTNSSDECSDAVGCVWDKISDENENYICKSAITWRQAQDNGIVSSSLNTWNSKENRYDDVEILEPFNGYWIHMGDLNMDGEITQNGLDNTMRYYVFYEPSPLPTEEEVDSLETMDWKFKLSMKPRRIDDALANQYGGDYIEVGIGEPDVVSDGFKFGEDEYNLKTFPTLTYPGDLFIQRADWVDSLLAPDNLRFYKDYRPIIYNWQEIGIASGCEEDFADESQESCESAGDCFYTEAGVCQYKYDEAYVWELTSIIGNATNVSENTTRDWVVKFEWNHQEAIDALVNIPNLPEDDTVTVNTDETAVMQLHYVKVGPEDEGSELSTVRVAMNTYPPYIVDSNGELTEIEEDCIPSEDNDDIVCIDIPYSEMLKLDNMGIEDDYTWNLRITLGKPVQSDNYIFGEEESVNDLGLPKKFEFGEAYPNPFNPSTTFDFALPKAVDVNIEVYNVLGQKVLVLADEQFMNAGFHQITLDGAQLSSGVYFVNARLGGDYRKVSKVILFK